MACLRTGKSLVVDDDEQIKKKRVKFKKLDDVDRPYLPEDMIIDHVLTRISPARTLYICSSVSKLWYNSIYNDKRFATSHFVQNQNRLSLFFNLLNQPVGETVKKSCIFRVEIDDDDDRFRMFNGFNLNTMSTTELVGCCNGLACFKLVVEDPLTAIIVVNPTRGDELCIYYPNFEEEEKQGYIPLCHGFSFDTISQVYKVVLIFTSRKNSEFFCVVYTLGTHNWRLTITPVADISSPAGLPPFPKRTETKILAKASRSATICGGDLFWRTTSDIDHTRLDFEMLLTFDLHHEKIYFTRLPYAATLTSPYRDGYFGAEYFFLDHHLLEFQGYPCIACLEDITISNSRRHRCLSLFCTCCSFSVGLYLLKDKVNQEWIEWDILKHFRIKDQERLIPKSFRCDGFNTIDDDTSPSAATITTPLMRLLTCSDQVLMYWYDGDNLALYNLHTKHLKMVKGSCDYQHIYRPCTGYQLHAQVENIHSLKTFIPDEEVVEYDCFEDFIQV